MLGILDKCKALYRDLESLYNFLSTNQITAGQERKMLDSYYLLLEGQYIVDVLKEQAQIAGLPLDSQEIQEAVAMSQQVASFVEEIESSYLANLSRSEKQAYQRKKGEKEALLEQNKASIAKNLGSIAQASISYTELEQQVNQVASGFGSFAEEKWILGYKYRATVTNRGNISLREENGKLIVRLPININVEYEKKRLFRRRKNTWKSYKSVDVLIDVPLQFGNANNILGLSVGNINFSISKLKVFGISVRKFAKKMINKYFLRRAKPKINAKLNEALQWDNISQEFQNRLEEIELTGIQPKIKVSLEETGIFARVDLDDDVGLKVDYSLIEKYIPQKTFNIPYLGDVTLEGAGLSFDNNLLSIALNLTGGINGTLNIRCLPVYDPKSGTITINDLDFDSETESLIIDALVSGATGLKDICIIPGFIKDWIGELIKTRLLTMPVEAIAREKIDQLDLPYVSIDSTKINIFDLGFGEEGLSLKFGKSILPLSILDADDSDTPDQGPGPQGSIGEGQMVACNDESLPELFPRKNGEGELRQLAGMASDSESGEDCQSGYKQSMS